MIISQNGNKVLGSASQQELDFPLKYVLKIIVDTKIADDKTVKDIEYLFAQLKINNNWLYTKPSNKNNFLSYSVEITLPDKNTMNNLYIGLKKIKAIKLAI